jgi:hypothetical protein
MVQLSMVNGSMCHSAVRAIEDWVEFDFKDPETDTDYDSDDY